MSKPTTTRRTFTKRLAVLAASYGVASVTPAAAQDAMTPACREAFARLPLKQQTIVVQTIASLAMPRKPVTADELTPFFTPAQAAANRELERETDVLGEQGGAR